MWQALCRSWLEATLNNVQLSTQVNEGSSGYTHHPTALHVLSSNPVDYDKGLGRSIETFVLVETDPSQ